MACLIDAYNETLPFFQRVCYDTHTGTYIQYTSTGEFWWGAVLIGVIVLIVSLVIVSAYFEYKVKEVS